MTQHKKQSPIAALLSKPGGRYLLVGGSVYLLELAVIIVAQHLGACAVAAVTISYITGTVVSFGLQKLFTFGDKRMHRRVLLPQAVAVGTLIMFNLGFTVIATKLLQDVLPVVVVRTLALMVTTIWNFYLYKTRIFKSNSV